MKTTRSIAFIALFTAILCVLSPLSIPLATLVPISLGTLAVYLIGALLDYKKAPICVLLYIAIGFMGLPIFAGFKTGYEAFAGPTAGFIVGYVFGIFFEAFLITKMKNRFFMYPLGMLVATIFIYAVGLVWFLIYMSQVGKNTTLAAAMMACMVPFLPGDAIKIVIASLLGYKLRKPLDRALMVPDREQSLAGVPSNHRKDSQAK